MTPIVSSHYSHSPEGLFGGDYVYSNEKMTWRDIYGSPVPPLPEAKEQGISKKEISRFIAQKWTEALADVIAEDFHIPISAIGRIFKVYTDVGSNLYARVVKRTFPLSNGEFSPIYVMCFRTCISRGEEEDKKFKKASKRKRLREGMKRKGSEKSLDDGEREEGEVKDAEEEEEKEENAENDDGADEEDDDDDVPGIPLSVGGLTNRVLIIFSEKNVMTVRRADLDSISLLRSEWKSNFEKSEVLGSTEDGTASRRLSEMDSFDFVNLLIRYVIQTYEKPFIEDQLELDHSFAKAMDATKKESEKLIARSTRIKRRTQVILRVLLLHQRAIEKYFSLSGQEGLLVDDLEDDMDTLIELGSELMDDADSLLDLHIMIKGHKVFQILRTLSLLTAVFYPAGFLTGLYGMNFDILPELHWTLGYLYAWMLIVGIALLTLLLFFFRGWLV